MVPANPYFTFHSMTTIGTTIYDPSYGLTGEPNYTEWYNPNPPPVAVKRIGNQSAFANLTFVEHNWNWP